MRRCVTIMSAIQSIIFIFALTIAASYLSIFEKREKILAIHAFRGISCP